MLNFVLFSYIAICSIFHYHNSSDNQKLDANSIYQTGYSIFIKEECLINNVYTNRVVISVSICVINCTFRSIGESTELGGAIYISINDQNENQNIIQNTSFINCFSNKGGSIYAYSQHKLGFNIKNCTFMNNKVTTQLSFGGAIFIESSNALFEECIFSSNSVLSQIESGESNGGSICSNISNITIINCKFNGNKALSTATDTLSKGASLCLISSFCDAKENTFDDNSLSQIFSFGAVSIEESESTFDHCYFTNNKANSEANLGAAFYLVESNATFNNCEFSNNLASASGQYSSSGGGAVYISSANATFNNCLFKNNKVSATGADSFSGGGAITSSLGIFVIEKCNFIDNIGGEGEILYIVEKPEESTLIINENIFERNSNTLSQMKSMIYLDLEEELHSINEFTNNKIFLMNTDRIYLFNGYVEGSVSRKWIFNNNCIYPYDQQYFKSDSLELFDQVGQTITFNETFQEECALPTEEISESTTDDDILNSYSSNNVNSEYNSYSVNYTCDSYFVDLSQIDKKQFSLSISFSITFFHLRSVSFSFSYSSSNIYSINGNNEVIIVSHGYSLYLFPYIIHYLSPSYVPTYISLFIKKARITAEQLIGIVCGTTAIFFFILYIIIRIIRKTNNQKDYLDWSISDEIDENIKSEDNLIDKNQNMLNNDNCDNSSEYDIDFWFN